MNQRVWMLLDSGWISDLGIWQLPLITQHTLTLVLTFLTLIFHLTTFTSTEMTIIILLSKWCRNVRNNMPKREIHVSLDTHHWWYHHWLKRNLQNKWKKETAVLFESLQRCACLPDLCCRKDFKENPRRCHLDPAPCIHVSQTEPHQSLSTATTWLGTGYSEGENYSTSA